MRTKLPLTFVYFCHDTINLWKQESYFDIDFIVRSGFSSNLEVLFFKILVTEPGGPLSWILKLIGWNLCMSIVWANWLLSRNITCLGTLNHNRQGILAELNDMSGREVFSKTMSLRVRNCKSITICYKSGLYLLSFTVKTKSSNKKNILLL